VNHLGRRLTAEFCGTALLVTVVVGSGTAAAKLSPGNAGIQLLENAAATAAGLYVLILLFGPVSGAHFNPVVSAVDWWVGRRDGPSGRHERGLRYVETAPAPQVHSLDVRERGGLGAGDAAAYVVAQLCGGVAGTILADAMFAEPLVRWSTTDRNGVHLWLGEVVATAGLVLLVFSLARTGRTIHAPTAVGVYIGAAYWFTSSTSFANPAVTVARAFTDTPTGIAPPSVPGFVAAQLIGALVGLGLLTVLFPAPPADHTAEDVVVPHEEPVP
jgi:glycerol uptake facilitator-like aquaporin